MKKIILLAFCFVVVLVAPCLGVTYYFGNSYTGGFSGSGHLYDFNAMGRTWVPVLFDRYHIDLAAGAINGTYCLTGQARAVTDTESKFSISGYKLVGAGGKATPGWGDPKISYPTQTRAAGLATSIVITPTDVSKNGDFGWDADGSGTCDFGLRFGGGATGNVTSTSEGPLVGLIGNNVDYQVMSVLRGTGNFIIVKGGIYPVPTLLHVSDTGTTASLRPYLTAYNMPFSKATNLWAYNISSLNSSWGTDNGIATFINDTPSSGDTGTAGKDALLEVTWTPATGELLDLCFRYTDDNNTWIARGNQTDGKIHIVKKINGVETDLASVAATFTAGTAYRIVVAYDHEGFRIATGVPGTLAFKTGQNWGSAPLVFNSNVTGAKVTINGAGTITKFRAWPRFPSIPAGLIDSVPVCDQLTLCGDSIPTNTAQYFYSTMTIPPRMALVSVGGRKLRHMVPNVFTGLSLTLSSAARTATLSSGIWQDYNLGNGETIYLMFSGFSNATNNNSPFGLVTSAGAEILTFSNTATVLVSTSGAESPITATTVEAYGSSQSDAADAVFDSQTKHKYCIVWAGTNDIWTNPCITDMNALYAMLSSFIAGRKAAGYTVIVPTMLPRGDAHIAGDVTKEGYRLAYNALIVANSAGADIVVNLDTAVPAMAGGQGSSNSGDPTYNLYNYYATNFSGDHIHPTAAGYQLLATAIVNAINTWAATH